MHPACRGHHRLKTFAHWHARPARPDEPYPPGTIIWTTPDGTDHPSPPPLLPGMPGWTLPIRTPDYPAQPESLTRIDLMPSAERTARRTNRWARALQWQADQQDRQRRAALKQAARQAAKAAAALRPPLARPKHAPWVSPLVCTPNTGSRPFNALPDALPGPVTNSHRVGVRRPPSMSIRTAAKTSCLMPRRVTPCLVPCLVPCLDR